MAPNNKVKKQALRQEYGNGKIGSFGQFIDLAKSEKNPCGFVGTVTVVVTLKNREKKAGSLGCQGMISRTHSSPSKDKIMVFLDETHMQKAEKMGFIVGDPEKIKQTGKVKCDIIFTEKRYFSKLKPIVPLLGKKRLLPSEKTGTLVTGDAEEMLKVARSYQEGSLTSYKKASDNSVAIKIGSLDLSKEQLEQNLQEALTQLERNHSKFLLVKKVISSSMFPLSFEYKS